MAITDIYKFVDEFLNPVNEQMRCAVLYNHETGLPKYVSGDATDALGKMRLPEIHTELYKELQNSGELGQVQACLTNFPLPQYGNRIACILHTLLPHRSLSQINRLIEDLELKRIEAYEKCQKYHAAKATSSSAAYNAEKIHVFGVQPNPIVRGQSTTVTVRGNGYDCNALPAIDFQLGQAQPVPFTPASIWPDQDLNEYLVVKNVTLNQAGTWKVFARRASGEKSDDCGPANQVEVVEP